MNWNEIISNTKEEMWLVGSKSEPDEPASFVMGTLIDAVCACMRYAPGTARAVNLVTGEVWEGDPCKSRTWRQVETVYFDAPFNVRLQQIIAELDEYDTLLDALDDIGDIESFRFHPGLLFTAVNASPDAEPLTVYSCWTTAVTAAHMIASPWVTAGLIEDC